MKFLSLVSEAYTIRQYIISITINLFHDSFESVFQAHPAVVCSLMSGLLVLNLLAMAIFALVLSKALVIGNPHLFLSLNHERTQKLIVSSIILLEFGDIVFSLLKCGNLCNTTTTLVFIMKKYDLQIDHELELCNKLPIFSIFLVLGTLLEIAIQIMCFLHNRELNVSVYTVQPCLKNNLTKPNKRSSVAPQISSEMRKPRRRLKTNDQQVPTVWIRELDPEESSLYDLANEQTYLSRGVLLRPGQSLPISAVMKHESLTNVEDVLRPEDKSTNQSPEIDEYSFIKQNSSYLQQSPDTHQTLKTELLSSTMILIRPPEEERKAAKRTQSKKERQNERGNKHSSLPRNNDHFTTTIPQYVLKSGHFTFSVLILFFFLGIENFIHQFTTEFSFSGMDMFNRVIAYYLAIYWCTFNKNIWKYTVRKFRTIISNNSPVFMW